jgi:Ca-activated chloride channel homolog
MQRLKHIFLLLALSCFLPVLAQKTEPLTRILFVFDASNSMHGRWDTKSKIEVARELLTQSMNELKGVENLELALRIYGHQTAISGGFQDCEDTKLEVPFGKNNHETIKRVIKDVNPKGTTPIAKSLEKAGGDFPPCTDCRNIIILITDGIEACDGDPCAVSRALQKENVILKPFVIGIGLDEGFMSTFECVGNYYDATNEATFRQVLTIVISQALNSTTAQLNLLNINAKPTETDVAVSFYNALNGATINHLVHTMNHRGVPDTLSLDPLITYNIVVHTIPPVKKEGIKLVPGIHNIIAIDAPQGSLELKVGGRTRNQELSCIVRKKGEMTTLNVQPFNQTEKYIVGKYDIEVLSLPRLYINDVSINQSHTTTIEIPQPGVANIATSSPGYGSIFELAKGEIKWVCDLTENVTNWQYMLLPGKYKVVYRSKNSKDTIFTKEQDFTIGSGTSTNLKF